MFFNARFEDRINVSQPDGFAQVGKEDGVYVLRKALYGIRQSFRRWCLTLQKFLVAFKFAQSKAYLTLYVLTRGGMFVMVLVYVDDTFLSAGRIESFALVVKYAKQSFKVWVDSKVEKFLGFSVQDSGATVKLHNAPMILRLLKAFGMQDCKPAKTASQKGLDLAADNSEKPQRCNTVSTVDWRIA